MTISKAQRVYRKSARGKEVNRKSFLKNRGKHTSHRLALNRRFRNNRKLKLMAMLGNKCIECGIKYDGANGPIFQFHHRDPATKMGQITFGGKWEFVSEEVKKCDLLCGNCHALHHSGRY